MQVVRLRSAPNHPTNEGLSAGARSRANFARDEDLLSAKSTTWQGVLCRYVLVIVCSEARNIAGRQESRRMTAAFKGRPLKQMRYAISFLRNANMIPISPVAKRAKLEGSGVGAVSAMKAMSPSPTEPT